MYNGLRPIACTEIHLLLLLVSTGVAVNAIDIVLETILQRLTSTTDNNSTSTEMSAVLGTAKSWTCPISPNHVIRSGSLLSVKSALSRLQILIRLVLSLGPTTHIGLMNFAVDGHVVAVF